MRMNYYHHVCREEEVVGEGRSGWRVRAKNLYYFAIIGQNLEEENQFPHWLHWYPPRGICLVPASHSRVKMAKTRLLVDVAQEIITLQNDLNYMYDIVGNTRSHHLVPYDVVYEHPLQQHLILVSYTFPDLRCRWRGTSSDEDCVVNLAINFHMDPNNWNRRWEYPLQTHPFNYQLSGLFTGGDWTRLLSYCLLTLCY